MIGYTPSHLTENEVILEKLNQIIDYLIKNPSYQVFAYNGDFVNGTLTYEIANIINSNNINVADVVVFNNGYYGIISEITETEFTLSQGISLIGPQGPQGPQGPKGDTGTIPEALPQEASALKIGSLPTSGWTEVTTPNLIWEGAQRVDAKGTKDIYNSSLSFVPTSDMKADTEPTHWQYKKSDGTWASVQRIYTTDGTHNGLFLIITPNGAAFSGYEFLDGASYMRIANGYSGPVDFYGIRYVGFTQRTYTIHDTSITANSDILMELTDEGGVKAYSMEAGSITVIRDTVPTSPIPYAYKIKQTNASGQFTLVNHFVPNAPVTSVNGQTGAVTIAVPTKTSELENDSGYVRSIVPPVVRNVVCNDVDSAATLDTTITCEIGDLILAQIIVRSALTLPTDWTLLRTIPAVETTNNQTLSFAYKRATSTSETLTVTQATAGRIYTNLVRLSNATSISYIQSCEKTGTGIKSILSTKPVTPNMVIWGASSQTWRINSPYGDWTYSPSTLDYYSLPQSTRAPRLGTFIDNSEAGERTFTIPYDSSNSMMCGAVEIVGDEVARKGDIPTKTSQLTNDSGFITSADIPSVGEWVAVTGATATLTEAGTYQVWRDLGGQILVYWDGQTQSSCTLPCVSFLVNDQRPYIHKYGASITAGGVLSITHESMTTDGTTNWTQSAVETESGFKYRKIN